MVSIRLRTPCCASRWFIGTLAWPSGRATHRPVEQVAGAHPQPPLRHDVEGEPGGVLVELADQRVDSGRVEGRPGQFVQRGHDADVGHVGRVRAAQHLRPATGRSRCRRTGSGWPAAPRTGRSSPSTRSASRLTWGSRNSTADRHPEPDDGRRRGHRARAAARAGPGPARPARRRPARAGPSAGAARAPRPPRPPPCATGTGPRPGQPVRRPAERGRQRAARQDPRPQRGNLARPLPGPRHRLRRAQHAPRPPARRRPTAGRPRCAVSVAPATAPISPANPTCCNRSFATRNLPSQRNKPAGSRVEGSI